MSNDTKRVRAAVIAYRQLVDCVEYMYPRFLTVAYAGIQVVLG